MTVTSEQQAKAERAKKEIEKNIRCWLMLMLITLVESSLFPRDIQNSSFSGWVCWDADVAATQSLCFAIALLLAMADNGHVIIDDVAFVNLAFATPHD